MNNFLVECCANSIKSALEGEKGGAHRIELCSNLEFGGITPSRKEISETKEAINIPIRVLIRPRVGDFIYNEHEYQQIISCHSWEKLSNRIYCITFLFKIFISASSSNFHSIINIVGILYFE